MLKEDTRLPSRPGTNNSTSSLSDVLHTGESRHSRVKGILGRVLQAISGNDVYQNDSEINLSALALPPRALSERQTVSRSRPLMLTDQDMDKLRRHRKQVRKDRRRMCCFCLYSNEADNGLGAPRDIECIDTPTPRYQVEIPTQGPYLNVEGLNTPRSGRSFSAQFLGPKSDFYHRPDHHAFPYQTAQLPNGQAKIRMPLHRNNYLTEEPVVDSYRVLLTHMSSNIGKMGSMSSAFSKIKFHTAQIGPNELNYFNTGQIAPLMTKEIQQQLQAPYETRNSAELSVLPQSSALTKHSRIGLAANDVRFKPMLSFEYAGPAFNQRLVGILWYLFEEYMMFPTRASQITEKDLTVNDFLKVNYAFWEYVGALLNTLVRREWLFDYLVIVLLEFPKAAGRAQSSGGSVEADSYTISASMADSLRAIRTSCYLICKLFDSKHDLQEVIRFHEAPTGSISCFSRMLELCKEEEGVGPATRLAMTYVFSRIRVRAEMIKSLTQMREQDVDYFRVHRITLRSFSMVWLKLVLLQEEKENEIIEGIEEEERDIVDENEARQLAINEARTVIALEHNTTIRMLYFQLFPEFNTKYQYRISFPMMS